MRESCLTRELRETRPKRQRQAQPEGRPGGQAAQFVTMAPQAGRATRGQPAVPTLRGELRLYWRREGVRSRREFEKAGPAMGHLLFLRLHANAHAVLLEDVHGLGKPVPDSRLLRFD